jgi:hypothetical protein
VDPVDVDATLAGLAGHQIAVVGRNQRLNY